jgi:hypothetical protein
MAINDLLDAMQLYGLHINANKLVFNKIGRCTTTRKIRDNNGWYIIFQNSAFITAFYGDHQLGESFKWCSKQKLSKQEKLEQRANYIEYQKQMEHEKKIQLQNINQQYAQFSLKHLAEEHNRAMLDGKLLNYGSEINSGVESDILKQLASGEPVQARYKYGNSFTIKNYARLIFNANELPRATEYTQAYFRRFLLIHFDQTITVDEINPELAKIIIATELAGVLNWVIDGATRLIENKKFSYCAKSEALLDIYKKESDVVALFLEDGDYQPHNNNKRLLKELYGEFKAFCYDNNYQALSDRRFSARLRELGYEVKRQKAGKSYVWIIQTGDY